MERSVGEVLQMRRQLERDIQKLIKDFEEDTGVNIKEIIFERVQMNDKYRTQIVNFQIPIIF